MKITEDELKKIEETLPNDDDNLEKLVDFILQSREFFKDDKNLDLYDKMHKIINTELNLYGFSGNFLFILFSRFLDNPSCKLGIDVNLYELFDSYIPFTDRSYASLTGAIEFSYDDIKYYSDLLFNENNLENTLMTMNYSSLVNALRYLYDYYGDTYFEENLDFRYILANPCMSKERLEFLKSEFDKEKINGMKTCLKPRNNHFKEEVENIFLHRHIKYDKNLLDFFAPTDEVPVRHEITLNKNNIENVKLIPMSIKVLNKHLVNLLNIFDHLGRYVIVDREFFENLGNVGSKEAIELGKNLNKYLNENAKLVALDNDSRQVLCSFMLKLIEINPYLILKQIKVFKKICTETDNLAVILSLVPIESQKYKNFSETYKFMSLMVFENFLLNVDKYKSSYTIDIAISRFFSSHPSEGLVKVLYDTKPSSFVKYVINYMSSVYYKNFFGKCELRLSETDILLNGMNNIYLSIFAKPKIYVPFFKTFLNSIDFDDCEKGNFIVFFLYSLVFSTFRNYYDFIEKLIVDMLDIINEYELDRYTKGEKKYWLRCTNIINEEDTVYFYEAVLEAIFNCNRSMGNVPTFVGNRPLTRNTITPDFYSFGKTIFNTTHTFENLIEKLFVIKVPCELKNGKTIYINKLKDDVEFDSILTLLLNDNEIDAIQFSQIVKELMTLYYKLNRDFLSKLSKDSYIEVTREYMKFINRWYNFVLKISSEDYANSLLGSIYPLEVAKQSTRFITKLESIKDISKEDYDNLIENEFNLFNIEGWVNNNITKDFISNHLCYVDANIVTNKALRIKQPREVVIYDSNFIEVVCRYKSKMASYWFKNLLLSIIENNEIKVTLPALNGLEEEDYVYSKVKFSIIDGMYFKETFKHLNYEDAKEVLQLAYKKVDNKTKTKLFNLKDVNKILSERLESIFLENLLNNSDNLSLELKKLTARELELLADLFGGEIIRISNYIMRLDRTRRVKKYKIMYKLFDLVKLLNMYNAVMDKRKDYEVPKYIENERLDVLDYVHNPKLFMPTSIMLTEIADIKNFGSFTKNGLNYLVKDEEFKQKLSSCRGFYKENPYKEKTSDFYNPLIIPVTFELRNGNTTSCYLILNKSKYSNIQYYKALEDLRDGLKDSNESAYNNLRNFITAYSNVTEINEDDKLEDYFTYYLIGGRE